MFRLTAQSLLQSKHIAIGAFGRRLRSRKGPSIAIKAVARKLAEQYWRLMVKGKEYVEKGVEHYIQQLNIQKMRQLQRLAVELDIELLA